MIRLMNTMISMDEKKEKLKVECKKLNELKKQMELLKRMIEDGNT